MLNSVSLKWSRPTTQLIWRMPEEFRRHADDMAEQPIEMTGAHIQLCADVATRMAPVRGLEQRDRRFDDGVRRPGAFRQRKEERIGLSRVLLSACPAHEMRARRGLDMWRIPRATAIRRRRLTP